MVLKSTGTGKLPIPGDKIKVWCSGNDTGVATVISVHPYTGRYPEYFTHVVRFTAERTTRGWMEISIKG